MATKTTIRTSKLGFPIRDCRRCNGEGYIDQYRSVHKGVCFACVGRRWEYASTEIANLAAEYTAAVRATRSTVAQHLQAGDTVYPTHLGKRLGPNRTVKSVRRTPRIIGSAWSNNKLTRLRFEWLVTWEDGGIERMADCKSFGRVGAVVPDIATFLARIPA